MAVTAEVRATTGGTDNAGLRAGKGNGNATGGGSQSGNAASGGSQSGNGNAGNSAGGASGNGSGGANGIGSGSRPNAGGTKPSGAPVQIPSDAGQKPEVGKMPAGAGQKPAQKPMPAGQRPNPISTVTTAPDGSRAYPSIVVFRSGVEGVAALASKQARVTTGREPEKVFSKSIKGWAGNLSLAQRRALAKDPDVAFVSPDRTVRALVKVRQAAEESPTGVRRIGGASPLTAFPGVAVLDTGIAKHSELVIRGGVNCAGGSPKAWSDRNGHGTHVAGTIAARANGSGVVGVAPGAPLWAVRVLDRSGSGTWSSIICGLDYVARNAGTIKVANLSLGGRGSDDGTCGATSGDALHRAICGVVAAGVTVVVAAGNSGANIANTVPAAYDEVITVSALADYDGTPGAASSPTCANYGADDTFASFSNFATTTTDRAHMLAAPGACITSTWLKGGFATISGTSMASPHVAGAAAAYLATNPTASPAAVLRALVQAGEPLGAGHTDPRGSNPEPVVRRP
jgi:subtilisin family serine protease